MPAWKLEQTSQDCFRCTWSDVAQGFEAHALLTSDHHVDNAHCNHALLRNHLQTAVELDAPIFMFGDTFCAMQGKWDRRADAEELIPELRGSNYLDKLVDYATEFYRPFASHIAIISNGNHEDSIEKHHETDLTERLVQNLKSIGGLTMRGRYMGFVAFSMKQCRGKKKIENSFCRTLCYHHGHGGGGPVTRGMIDNNRTRTAYMSDIFYSGHIHYNNTDKNEIVSMDRNGHIIRRLQRFLRGGAYKDDFQGRWQIQRGHAARPLGGYWVRFRYRATADERLIDTTAIEATWGRP